MLIGGFLPLSLCDYPGKMAAVVFTQGCNFRCPYCHNGALLTAHSETAIAVSDVLASLHSRRKFLDGVVISGGEPTLHADLADFLVAVRSMGYAVKLDTNGSRPKVLRDLFDRKLLDFVAMDVKAPLSRYEVLAGIAVETSVICESIDLIAESGVRHQFRTTNVLPLLASEDLAAVRAMIPARSSYSLQSFRSETALDPSLRV